MLSRTLRRALPSPATLDPQAIRLPIRTLSTAPQSTSTANPPNPPPFPKNAAKASSTPTHGTQNARPTPPPGSNPEPISIPRTTTSTTPARGPKPLHESVTTLLPLLRAQAPHYITAQLHGKSYLLTPGDVLRLPFLMPRVAPGDVLRLNCATALGSRDYTLRAAAGSKGSRTQPKVTRYLDERLFVCRARVMGVESEPMRVKEKTKRRQRHVRLVKSKHRYTVLRVTEVTVRGVEDLVGEEGGTVLSEEAVGGLEEGIEEGEGEMMVEVNEKR